MMTPSPNQEAVTEGNAALRARLIGLRDTALRQLAEVEHIDTGLVGLVADVQTVLAYLDSTSEVANVRSEDLT